MSGWTAVAALALAATAGKGDPAALAAPRVAAVDVVPETVVLEGRLSYVQLLVMGEYHDGTRVDLTREATLAGPSTLVTLDERGLVRPAAQGEGELRLAVAGHDVRVPVSVRGLAAPLEPSFVQDVAPRLSRLGCNSGTCHGSAGGQNGFALSLRGYDPALDHAALTDDLAGRRFDRVVPEESLFLLKPTAAVPHEGGQVLEPDSPAYDLLRAWVANGAAYDARAPRVASIEVRPSAPVVPLPGMAQQLAVIATYEDGRERDVTREAFYESSDPDVASVDGRALVETARRGETAILVRYEGRYAAARVFVMGERSGWTWDETPEHNWIDGLVYEKLRRIRSRPSEPCSDAEFLRRVHLDLTGRPPAPHVVRTFLLDGRDARTKRDEVIDRLIGSAAFVDHWANRWADLLQVSSKYLGEEGASAWREWLRAQVASNAPYDRFVAELLGASGSTLANPPAAFWKVQRQPDLAMETTTQLFLGVRFNCNKCHDHPFERWTQDQHWQLAAYFAQIGRENAPGSPLMPERGGNQPGDERLAFEEIVSDSPEGEVHDPDTGAVVAPAFPYRHAGAVPEGGPRRARLVAWLTAPENPYFASSYANRLWSYFLGAGLIEPVDDVRAGNPPTNPELLDRLTRELVESGFDARHLMRLICRSRTYQHALATNAWNEDDHASFAHALARRLPAEVLYDAVHQATGTRPALPGTRPGTRAADLVDASVKAADGFLDLFGRPPRESACECERSNAMSLGQALNLVNGPTVADAIRAPGNEIAELVRYERDDRRVLEELYLRFLCRPPTAAERDALVATLDPAVRANRAALSPEDAAELERRFAAWQAAVPRVEWHPPLSGTARSEGGATLAREDDGSFRASGAAPEQDRTMLALWTERVGITGLRLEVLPDEELPGRGPGRADNGNFVLNELSLTAVPLRAPGEARVVELVGATADFSQDGFPVADAIDGKPETGWAVSPRLGVPHEAVFETGTDVGAEGGTLLVLTLAQQYGGRHTLGRLRVSVTTSARPVRHHGLPPDVAAALGVAPPERSEAELDLIHRHFVATDREMADRIRLGAAQDLAWALANSPGFLFNR